MRIAAWILSIAATLVGILVLLFVAVLQFLSDPDRATPFIRNQIEDRTDRPTTLEAGWVDLAWSPTLRLRSVAVEELADAELFDVRFNVFSMLFGGRLVRHVQAENADYTLTLRDEEGEGGPPPILDHVRAVDALDIRLVVVRPEREAAEVVVSEASGDLVSGDFSLTASGGRANLALTGRAAGLSLEDFEGSLQLDGQNFADFAALLGLSAPDTPPFSLSGDLSRDGRAWRFEPFSGVVGDSDLSGSMVADFTGERPLLIADLTSSELDLDDLGVAIGAPSSVSAGEENAEQQAANNAYAADARYIPNARLDFTRMRAADAEVTFSAGTVYAGSVPLSSMEFNLELEDAILTFQPISFDAPQGGRLTVYAAIDAQSDTVVSDVAGRLDDFEMANIASGQLARGELVSRFELGLTGSDLRGAFASANGEVVVWATPGAHLRHLAVEGSGLDLGEVILLMLEEDEGDPQFIPVRCAGARFTVADGIASTNPVILDTEDSLIRMTGEVSLRNETLGLDIEADAKDISWGNLLGGVRISGTLRDPAVTVNALPSLLQGGAAALLASVAGPLAAVPFTDLGLGEDAPCSVLMSQTQGNGSIDSATGR